MRHDLTVPLVLMAVALALPGCGGAGKSAEDEWTAMPEEKPRPFRDTTTLNPAAVEPERPTVSALVGVRHDLMLSNQPHPSRCPCLAVETGGARDPNFFWSGGAPEIGSNAVVVALGARGVPCPGGDTDEARRRPSISAVDQEDDDVIIEVEDLPQGRPLASGAIIPRPRSGGSIYVKPREPGQVYVKGGRCKVR